MKREKRLAYPSLLFSADRRVYVTWKISTRKVLLNLMNIKLDFYPEFVKSLENLKNKYGEKFLIMNGFSDFNLNFTDFIDNFIKSSSVADTTIDANANSTTMDVRTLLSDMVKPHTKLLS